MRGAVVLLLMLAGCFASVIEFVSLPKSLTLPSSTSELRTRELSKLNANILGLSAESVPGFEVKSNLFLRPRALATVRIDGIDYFEKGNASTYKLDYDRIDMVYLDEQLASTFGADRETVTVNSKGISGSAIAHFTESQGVEEEIKTKLPILHEELEQLYRLIAAVKVQKTKFEKTNAADVYRVTISGLGGLHLSKKEREVAVEDIRRAVTELADALAIVYGDEVVLEVLAMSNAVKYSEDYQEQLGMPSTVKHSEDYHEHLVVRRKRAADLTDTDKNLKTWREMLNVYVFVSTDYPAMFAIFAGLIIVLILAVLYTVVGMMSMDPSKDSIIYRMTTTRMKKA